MSRRRGTNSVAATADSWKPTLPLGKAGFFLLWLFFERALRLTAIGCNPAGTTSSQKGFIEDDEEWSSWTRRSKSKHSRTNIQNWDNVSVQH